MTVIIPDSDLIGYSVIPEDPTILRSFEKAHRALESRLMQSLGIPSELFTGTNCYSSASASTSLEAFNARLRSQLAQFPFPFARFYGALQLISAPYMTTYVQYRFPRSKKKRIRKKWAKDKRNWRHEPMKVIWQMGNTVFAHPAVIDRIKKAVDTQCQTP